MISDLQKNLIELINGDKFEGVLKNNSSLAQGKYLYRNGDVYEGKFL